MQRKHLERAEGIGVEEESTMVLYKDDRSCLSETTTLVMNREECQPLVYQRRAGWGIRVRGIDCALADIQAQIEILQQERTYLRLVQKELAGIEAKHRSA